MARKGLLFVFAGLLLMAMSFSAASVSAGTRESKKDLKATITLPSAVSINGTTLKPGDYYVVATGSKVTLSQYGKVVAEANAEIMDGQAKQRANAVVLDEHQQVKRILFNGKAQYAVIQ